MGPQRYLKAVDWTVYLEREQPLFLFAAFIRAYGPMLKQTTGIGFFHQLHRFQGTVGIFYRSEKEMRAVDLYFARLIDSKDTRIEVWLRKEKALLKELKCLDTKDPAKVIAFFEKALLYNTVIPYRLLSAFQHTRHKHTKLQAALENIRADSLYPKLLATIIKKLFEKAARKVKIPENLASLLTPQEIIGVLIPDAHSRMPIHKEELEKRERHCYFYATEGERIEFYFGRLDSLEQTVDVALTDVKGQCAWKGKARGIVKIVNNASQMSKFNSGDILFSINTNPSLMPIIRKAAAIVTDEGGITCHAAIVARELRIPCIIGTRFATKVYKDGDEVEVNATKGIVRKPGKQR